MSTLQQSDPLFKPPQLASFLSLGNELIIDGQLLLVHFDKVLVPFTRLCASPKCPNGSVVDVCECLANTFGANGTALMVQAGWDSQSG